MEKLLRISGLTKHFGGVIACEDLSFDIDAGRIVGVIGPNGAGKTTLFNLITGAYPPTAGEIVFNGEPIHAKRPDIIAKKGISRTFQNIRLFKNLSLRDNIIIALDMNNTHYSFFSNLIQSGSVRKKERELKSLAMEYLEVVGLAEKAMDRADSLPYGLQRKLEIARALALQPKLLLLDEPAAGMNPEESMDLAALVRSVKEAYNLTVILIEHHMNVVMDLCDNIVVVNFGRKLAEGTPRQIQNDPDVIKAYLGGKSENA